MASATKTKGTKGTKLAMAGAAAAAAAAGAAGVYYFYISKDAKKHRKEAVKWMVKAEREVITEAKKLTDAAFTEANYRAIIAAVLGKYQRLVDVDRTDIEAFRKFLMGAWKEIKKSRSASTSSGSRGKTKKTTRRKNSRKSGKASE